MKPGIGEFLAEKAVIFTKKLEIAELLMVETFLRFLDKEIGDMVESQFAEQKSKYSERVVRQFEGVLFRYADPQQWCNFLVHLKKRGRLGSLPSEFVQWLLAADELDPANRCLEATETSIKERYYDEDTDGHENNPFPPIEEEAWRTLVEDLKKHLHAVVLRELLLRAVRTVIDEKAKDRLRRAMQGHEESAI